MSTDAAKASLKTADSPLKGILLMCMGMSIVPVMDGFAKYLSEIGAPVLLIVWARFFFNFVIVAPIVFRTYGGETMKPALPGLLFVRSLALLGATYLFFFAISTIPIVDALGIYFIYPLTVMALSPVMLGESAGVRRWTAAIAGFGGAMLIVQPGAGEMEAGKLWAILGSFCFGFYVVSTRRLAGRVPPLMVLFHQSWPSAVIMTILLPWIWRTPTMEVLLCFVAIGAISAVGHLLLIKAFTFAPAPVLSPLSYFEIVTATIVGYFWFDDFPGPMTWAGIVVIIGSGLYITWRETLNTTPRPLERPLK